MKQVLFKKVLFSVLGEIGMVKSDGIDRKRFLPNSPDHLIAIQNRLPVGTKITCTFSKEELRFSESQRKYHFVLLGYIADYNQNTVEDEHDDSMKEVFGIRYYKNYKGEQREGRYSINDASSLKNFDVQKLIDHDLAICKFLKIRIPTRKELGYPELDEKLKTKYPLEEYKEPLI